MGVTSVKIQQSTKTLTLRFDPGVTTREKVVASVESIVANIH